MNYLFWIIYCLYQGNLFNLRRKIMNVYLKPIAALSLFVSSVAGAGVIIGGDLLDQNGANFLETQLGLGDLDFSNVSDLTAGASASTWHTDVSGLTDVISIYDITFNGENFLLGGYSAIGHDGQGYSTDYGLDNTNFIFNLSSSVVRFSSTGYFDDLDQYDSSSYFATFGGGHDLYGGRLVLEDGYAYQGSTTGDGYSYGGGAALLPGFDGIARFTVNGIESFTFSTASPVPEPSLLALMGLGIFGLGLSRRKMNK